MAILLKNLKFVPTFTTNSVPKSPISEIRPAHPYPYQNQVKMISLFLSWGLVVCIQQQLLNHIFFVFR